MKKLHFAVFENSFDNSVAVFISLKNEVLPNASLEAKKLVDFRFQQVYDAQDPVVFYLSDAEKIGRATVNDILFKDSIGVLRSDRVNPHLTEPSISQNDFLALVEIAEALISDDAQISTSYSVSQVTDIGSALRPGSSYDDVVLEPVKSDVKQGTDNKCSVCDDNPGAEKGCLGYGSEDCGHSETSKPVKLDEEGVFTAPDDGVLKASEDKGLVFTTPDRPDEKVLNVMPLPADKAESNPLRIAKKQVAVTEKKDTKGSLTKAEPTHKPVDQIEECPYELSTMVKGVGYPCDGDDCPECIAQAPEKCVDSNGDIWDSRVHSGSKAKTGDGVWLRKKATVK